MKSTETHHDNLQSSGNCNYLEIGKEIDDLVQDILIRQYDPSKNHAVWCQEIMLWYSIPQSVAAKFLKEKFNIKVELLPVPEIRVLISDF